MKAESVSWMSPTVPPRSTAITGSAGRYMSMESGVKAESRANRISSTGVSRGRLSSEVGAMGAFIAAGLAANPCRVPCYKRAMTSLPDMTEMQIRRYARHIVLAEIGGTGQARLIAAKVLVRSEEHTSELQSPDHLVCRLLLEKKKKKGRFLSGRTTVHRA